MSFNANCIWPGGSEVLLITPSGGVPMVRTAFAGYGAVRQIEEFVGGAHRFIRFERPCRFRIENVRRALSNQI
jgi:hypothetical protein